MTGGLVHKHCSEKVMVTRGLCHWGMKVLSLGPRQDSAGELLDISTGVA
jgi:hypothetical protein